jgi:hypothetical protein
MIKLVWFVVFHIFLSSVYCGVPQNVRSCCFKFNFLTHLFVLKYTKFTKVQCSATGKTCDNLWCNVKLVARNNTLLNFNCDFKRPLKKFYVNMSLLQFMLKIYIFFHRLILLYCLNKQMRKTFAKLLNFRRLKCAACLDISKKFQYSKI